jgi:hypothetical protein
MCCYFLCKLFIWKYLFFYTFFHNIHVCSYYTGIIREWIYRAELEINYIFWFLFMIGLINKAWDSQLLIEKIQARLCWCEPVIPAPRRISWVVSWAGISWVGGQTALCDETLSQKTTTIKREKQKKIQLKSITIIMHYVLYEICNNISFCK